MQIYRRVAGTETLTFTATGAFVAGDLDATVDMIVQATGACQRAHWNAGSPTASASI